MKTARSRAVIAIVASVALAGASSDGIAATYRWAHPFPGAWGNPIRWDPPRNTPLPDDRMVFDLPTSIVAFGISEETIGQLVVENGCQVFLRGIETAGGTLTLSGLSGHDLSVAAGSSLTIDSTWVLQIVLPTGTTGRVEGSVALRGPQRLLASDPSSLVFTAGSQMEAELPSGNPFGTTSLESVLFEAGSLYKHRAGGSPFGAAAPFSVVRFAAGSRFRLDTAVNPSVAGRTYGDFEFNAPGTVTNNGTNTFQVDSLIVTQGTWNLNLASIRIRGDVRFAGGDLNFLRPGSSQVTFAGASRQQLTMLQAPHGLDAGTSVNFEVDNPAGILMRAPMKFPGTMRFTRGMVVTLNNLLEPGAVLGASQGTGWVAGNLGLGVPAGAERCTLAVGDTLHYLPMIATFHGLGDSIRVLGSSNNTDILGISFEGSGLDSTRLLDRWWLFSPFGAAPAPWMLSYDLEVAIHADDVAQGLDLNSIVVRRWNGYPWQPLTLGGVSPSALQFVGLTDQESGVFAASMSALPAEVADRGGSDLALAAPVPNPIAGSTRISFALTRDGRVRLAVYDAQGRLVESLVDGMLPAGRHWQTWSPVSRRVHAGIYMIRLEAGDRSVSRRVVVMP